MKNQKPRATVSDRTTTRSSENSTSDPYERIIQLELQVQELTTQLNEVTRENERLQDVVVKLDEINRKMVVDLMKELSQRSQEVRRRRSSSGLDSVQEESQNSLETDDESESERKTSELGVKDRFDLWDDKKSMAVRHARNPSSSRPIAPYSRKGHTRENSAASSVPSHSRQSSRANPKIPTEKNSECSLM